MAWATSLAFLCAAGLMIGEFGVTGTPSQLRLSHSGYEIISFNDEDPSNPGSLGSTRIEMENCTSSGIGDIPSSLRVEDSLGEDREIPGEHEAMRWSRGSKIGRDTRPNRIDVGSKARSSGVYLTLGIPGRLVRGDNPQKDSAASVGMWDDTNNRVNSGDRGELVAALIETKIRDEKHEDGAKTGLKYGPVPESPKDLDRVDEDSPKSRDIDQETLPKISIADVPIGKSKNARRIDRIGASGTKFALSKLAKFPSIRIHNPGTYWPPAASPDIFSPVYPALGFDVPSDLSPKAIPLFPNVSRGSGIGTKSPMKKINVDAEPRRGATDLGSNDLGAQFEDTTRSSNQRLASLMLINGAKRELPMLRTVNRLSLELADLVPSSGASLDAFSLDTKNRGPLEKQRDTDSMSHAHWEERLDDSDRIIEVERTRAEDDDYDSIDLDVPINRRISKNVSRVKAFGHQESDKFNVTSRLPNFLIDIVHNIAPVVRETSHNAVNKSRTLKNIVKPRNSTRPRDSNAASAKYKRTRNLGVPSYYKFVAKFTDLVLENALRYETSPRGNRDEVYSFGSGTV